MKKHLCSLTLLLSLQLIITSTTYLSASSQPPELVFTVPDTALSPGEEEAFINIYIDNFIDTIAGFQFQLSIDRPDLVTFNFDHNGYDTAGTLVSGFEYVWAGDTSGTNRLLWFRCIANANPFDGVNTPGFAPQQGGTAIRIPVNTNPNPDTTGDMTCNLTIVKPFDFSDPWGKSIGVVTDTITDTIYYRCTEWSGDSCLHWVEVSSSGPYDSIYVYQYLHGWLDTTVVIPVHGSITIHDNFPITCDNDGNGKIDVADLSCLIDYLFVTWKAEICPNVAYCIINGNTEPTIEELAALVDYLFLGGPAPGE